MLNKRISQVNELIQHEMNQIFLREMEFPKGSLVTITCVDTSVDLEHAKIWYSVLPSQHLGRVQKILESNIYHLQQLLNRKLVMQFVPKIEFRIDSSQAKAERINELLDSLDKE